jgi:hypothetical protein
MGTALVLTGESQLADVEAQAPDDRPRYVLDRVDRLLPEDVWRELQWTDDDAS